MSEDEQPPWGMDQAQPRQLPQGGARQQAQQQSQVERARPRTAQAEKAERAQATYQAVGAIMRDNKGAEAKAIKAMIPPSPRLSARMMNITYLTDTTKIIAQKNSDNAPRMFSGVVGIG